MKPYTGSIQRKNGWLYLVIRNKSKSKWIALATRSLRVARGRAAEIAPRETDETRWLERLAELGEKAKARLAGRRGRGATWESLAELWLANPAAPSSEDSRAAQMRWIAWLAASHPPGTAAPAALDAAGAARTAKRLCAERASAPRMIRFYKMLWKTLALGGAWQSLPPVRTRREYYRRLSREEISALIAYLRQTDPQMAGIAEIGYATGLRLSDAAGLETSALSSDGAFLRVVPRKTRHAKPQPLLIPVARFLQPRLRRLAEAAGKEKRAHLFSERLRKRPTRLFQAAFRACGILKSGSGRAGFHSLRATFISMMDEAGVPPHVTDAITGHAPAGMHGRYTQPSAAARAAAIERAIPPV